MSLSDEQQRLIYKVAHEKGFNNFSISVEEGSKKGDNYLGNVFLINVNEKDTCKEDCYILKCAETNPDVRNQFPIHKVYEREVFLYQTVLPAFETFQEKRRIKHRFRAYAKILGSSMKEDNEFLLMENIRSRGFSMLDRRETMDDEHVTLVIREMAKLHSISLAMKHTEPETYKALSNNLDDYFVKHENIKETFKAGVPEKIEVALKIVEGHEKATKALTKCRDEFGRALDDMMESRNHLVIIHGDPWCNNMMFKYEDASSPNVPTSMCFLDWQISRTQSPVTDLQYFLFLSSSKQILDNYQKYLYIYHQTIDENLQNVAGCSSDNKPSVFSYGLLLDHWSKYSGVLLLITLSNLQPLLKDAKDAKNLVDMAQGGRDLMNEFWKAEDLSEEYRRRVKDIILSLVEQNCL